MSSKKISSFAYFRWYSLLPLLSINAAANRKHSLNLHINISFERSNKMGFFLSTTANVSNNAANGNANAVASGTAQNDVPAISTSNVLMSDSLSSSPTDTNATTTHSRATPASNSLVLTGIAELGLRFAPPEVRRMIFEYTFERRWVDLARQKKLLALFEALRGDQLLYDEAWNIYLEFTTFVINWRRPPRQTCILFQAIRKLEIRFQ